MSKIVKTLPIFLLTLFFPKAVFATKLSQDPNFSCTDLKILYARGSGAELHDADNYQVFEDAFTDTFKNSGLSLSFYELGSQPGGYNGYSYPSPGIGIHTWARFKTSLGAVVSGGWSYAFGESVEEGASEAEYFISNYAQLCPNSKIVIGGYSQGGQVVSRTVQKINPDNIFAALTFGDPKLYLPEGKPDRGANSSRACREGRSAFSHYRTFVPDCYTYEGVLGGYVPYDPYLSPLADPASSATPIPFTTQNASNTNPPTAGLAASERSPYYKKLKAYCQHHDVICSSYIDPAHFTYGHASYNTQGTYKRAAEDVYNELFPDAPIYKREIQNIVLLIDNTQSMTDVYARYYNQIITVAQKYLEHGDQLALYTYRDLYDNPRLDSEDGLSQEIVTPKQLCDFGTCTLDNIPDLLRNVAFAGGGDPPESLLSSAYTIMKELKWDNGANKSIIVITEADFHNPDRDKTTLAQVVELSEQIDPVNFYFVVPDYLADYYQSFADQTHGAVYPFPRRGNPDEAMLDLAQNIANHLGDYGLIKAREEPAVGEITALTFNQAEETLVYAFNQNTKYTILTINKEILGYRELTPQDQNQDQITITDLDYNQENQICVLPISQDNYRSEGKCLIIAAGSVKAPGSTAEPIIPKAPNTGKK